MNKECVVKAGELYDIKATDISTSGDGIGKVNGFTVFVKGLLPEESAKVKITEVRKRFAFGEVVSINEKSPYRTEPFCSCFDMCGGCSLQHMTYEGQLKFKTKRIKDVLERIGKFENPVVLDTIGMENPYHYRNKMQYHVSEENGKCVFGFYSEKSHRVVPCENCYVGSEENSKILNAVKKYIDEFKISIYDRKTHSGAIRHVVIRNAKATGEIMVCIVVNDNKLPKKDKLVSYLKEIDGVKSIVLNVNEKKTNVIMGEKSFVLYGRGYITDYIGDIRFDISPLSFYQVNPVQTNVLYSKALELAGLTGSENVLDIYCGIGTISLFLAQKAKKVIGIEIVPEAVNDAKHNAEINGITNAEFIVGSAEDIIPEVYEKGYMPDVVVVDPPRKGCDEKVLETIIKMKPEKVVYVSCEPSTFARDLKMLCENGYIAGEVQGVDQFCHGTHVESVIMMTYCGKEAKNEG